MKLFPAIDLIGGRAVRLFQGDYDQMTVYHDNPAETACAFAAAGAEYLHLVDLEGAKNGNQPNLSAIKNIRAATKIFLEIGGGIRTMETVDLYLSMGIDRVIIGTAAVEQPDFLSAAIAKYGERIAVGVDMKDGRVATRGWTEASALDGPDFCKKMEQLGVSTLICTDISKDGAMKGTNLDLYRRLSATLKINITASGGVSSLADITALRALNLYGAIVGKACYTGALDLKAALEAAK